MKTTSKVDSKISVPRLRKNCEGVSTLLRAVSHPMRLLILGCLVEGEKTVTEIQELCGISQSQVSQFLARMRLENLVQCTRRGRHQYYSPADARLVELILKIQSLYCH